MKLKEKVALITGSGQGIGRSIATLFVKEGAKLIINDIIEERAEMFSKELESQGNLAIPIVADVSNIKQVETMVEKAVNKFGRIDILINNAGISYKKDGLRIPLLEISEEQWDSVLDVNLKGMFLCAQKVGKVMMDQKYGRIVNMASTAGKLGSSGPAGINYMASKAAVMSLTKSLATELINYNIRVNGIAPGFIKTEMAGMTNKELNKTMLEKIPMKRFGTPEEVAEVALFLVSDSSSYLVGETIIVDGGFLMD